MTWAEILLIVACAAIVIGVTVCAVIRKKKGKCSCDCESCSHCAYCSHGNEENKK